MSITWLGDELGGPDARLDALVRELAEGKAALRELELLKRYATAADSALAVELKAKMKKARAYVGDNEGPHRVADDFLLKVLRSLGYKELCKVFEDLDKWYA